jgi:hypothetical protein
VVAAQFFEIVGHGSGTKALQHCVLDTKGNVHFNNSKLNSREKLRLTLAARAIGAQMDTKMKSEVSVEELSVNTGLPRNQVRARAAELVKEKLASSPSRGHYAAVPYKVEALIDSVADSKRKTKS